MKNILFTGDTLTDEVRVEYNQKGFNIIPASYDLTEDEVAQKLVECDGYILGGDEIASKSLLEKAGDKLKAISFFGAGYEKYVDANFAKQKGILVSNTPGANADSVSEFTVALLLAATKNIIKCNADTKSACWDRPKTSDIRGKTVGIIGMGNIGSRTAKTLSKGFDCEILYTSRTQKQQLEEELGAKYVTLEDLLKASDIIIVHAAFSESTRGLINAQNISLLKKGAILVNTARAEIVEEEALVVALKEGILLRAAFDVFYEEPINSKSIVDGHEILSLGDEKFIITPHMAYYTVDAIQKMEQMALDNICEMLNGEACQYVVNK